MPIAMHLLSQTPSSALTGVFIPLAIVLVCTGLLLAVLSIVRSRMRGEQHRPRDFTLTELRELHRTGQLTDEEFDRAKSLLVGKVHTSLAKEVKPSIASKPLNADLKSELPPERPE